MNYIPKKGETVNASNDEIQSRGLNVTSIPDKIRRFLHILNRLIRMQGLTRVAWSHGIFFYTTGISCQLQYGPTVLNVGQFHLVMSGMTEKNRKILVSCVHLMRCE
jgi:hypothetical protein